MLRTNPPQSEPNIWMQIEKRIAELLDGGPAPTDPEDVRMPEYKSLLQALDEMEYHAGVEYRKQLRHRI